MVQIQESMIDTHALKSEAYVCGYDDQSGKHK